MENKQLSEIDYWERLSELMGESFVQFVKTRGQLQEDLGNAKNYYEKLMSLRRYYESNMDDIMATYVESKYYWASVYPTDWSRLFTEIEYQAWCSIRSNGRIVLYPQFPIENYFVDFANPGLKIVLELDGKMFHDKEKDRQRDSKLKDLGWTIYRITGAEMYRTNYTTFGEIDFENDSEDEIYEKLSYWLLETGDGVIQAIKEIHFEDDFEMDDDDDDDDERENVRNIYSDLCHKTLLKHKA